MTSRALAGPSPQCRSCTSWAFRREGPGTRQGEEEGRPFPRKPKAALSAQAQGKPTREAEAKGASGRSPGGCEAPIRASPTMCHRAAGARGHTCLGRRHPARPARPLPPARPHLDTPGCSHRSRRPQDSPEATPAPRAARRVPSRRGVREAHLIVAAGAGARGRARGSGRGALAGEPAPGAAAPRLAGLRGAAGVHLLGAGVRAASCGDGLRPRCLTAGPRPLPSWRARARAGECARRRGRWKEGRGRRPPDPLTERREGEFSPRAETEGAPLRPLRGCARVLPSARRR